jgi:hypothetical protein
MRRRTFITLLGGASMGAPACDPTEDQKGRGSRMPRSSGMTGGGPGIEARPSSVCRHRRNAWAVRGEGGGRGPPQAQRLGRLNLCAEGHPATVT